MSDVAMVYFCRLTLNLASLWFLCETSELDFGLCPAEEKVCLLFRAPGGRESDQTNKNKKPLRVFNWILNYYRKYTMF